MFVFHLLYYNSKFNFYLFQTIDFNGCKSECESSQESGCSFIQKRERTSPKSFTSLSQDQVKRRRFKMTLNNTNSSSLNSSAIEKSSMSKTLSQFAFNKSQVSQQSNELPGERSEVLKLVGVVLNSMCFCITHFFFYRYETPCHLTSTTCL